MEGRDTGQDTDGGAEGRHGEPISGSPEELYELGGRLLERGDARRAAEVFAAAAGPPDARESSTPAREGQGADEGSSGPEEAQDEAVRGRALAGLGIARLEEAIAAFRAAAESAGADVRPLAVELLARSLPLRDRDDEAARVWRRGLEDRDPEVAAAVRARLRRAFGSGYRQRAADGGGGSRRAPGAATTGALPWWDGFLESAVCHGTLPLLANELFAALDHMYAVVAVSYTRGGTRASQLRDALAEAVRLPRRYAWGAALQDSFRRRLRDVTGAGADGLPRKRPQGSSG